MAFETQHIVQPFVRTRKGRVDAGRAQLCASAASAVSTAERLVADGIAIGAFAMSRSADIELGDYEMPEILIKVGRIPGDEDDLPF